MFESLCYLTGEVMIANDAASGKLLFARLQKENPNLAELRKKIMGY